MSDDPTLLFKLVSEDLPKLKRGTGDEYSAQCPFHDDTEPSLSVNAAKGLYYCHGCGAKGGAYNWLTEYRKLSKAEAMQIIKGPREFKPKREPKPERPKKQIKFVDALPKNAEAIYRYYHANGKQAFLIARIGAHGGKRKQFFPLTPCVVKGKPMLAMTQRMDEGRPIYGLLEIIKRPDEQVTIAEGEKCADALTKAFPKQLSASWAGGTNAWSKTDWEPLRERKVVLLSDADEPGRKTMTALAARLHGMGCKVRVALPEDDKERNDIADVLEHDGKKGALDWIKRHLKEWKPPKPKKEAKPPPEITPTMVGILAKNDFFEVLGNDGDRVQVKLWTSQILSVPRSYMTRANQLYSICPEPKFWSGLLQSEQLTPGLAAVVGCQIIMEADRRGQVDFDRIVHRGASESDDGRLVWHLGDRLLVDEKIVDINDPPDKRIYIPGARVDIDDDVNNTLDLDTRQSIAEILLKYRWQSSDDGKRMLGWIVSSLAGGGLEWRPHVWLISRAGQGKSWFLRYVLSRILHTTVATLADPTAAAISRQMQSDSLPVVIDEAEPDRKWIDDVVTLARVAAGDFGARTRADGSSGGVIRTKPRFSALMSSTKLPALSAADNQRFSMVQLSEAGVDDWPALQDEILKIFNKPSDMPRAIRSTVIHQSLAIRETAKRFSAAAMADGVDARQANLSAALSAGWHWWTGEELRLDSTNPQSEGNDAKDVLGAIFAHPVRKQSGTEETLFRAIGTNTGDIPELYGMRMADDGFLIASDHSKLREIIKRTGFGGTNLTQLLMQLPGAEKTSNPRHFGGMRKRAILIPYDVLKDDLGFDLQSVYSNGAKLDEQHEDPF